MIKPRRKLIIGTALMLVMVAILWVIMMGYNLALDFGSQFKVHEHTVSEKYQGVIDTFRELEESYQEAYDQFYSMVQVKADMTAKALYKVVSEETGSGVRKLGKGCVVKIENGEMTAPSGARTGIKNYTDKIKGNGGTLIYNTPTINGIRKDILVFSHIKGPYYYVEIINGEELRSYVSDYVGLDEIIFGIEFAYNIKTALYCPDHENSRFFFCYPSDEIFIGEDLAQFGAVVREATGSEGQEATGAVGQEVTVTSDEEELNTLGRLKGMKGVDGSSVIGYIEDIEELDCTLLLAFAENNTVIQALEGTAVGNLAIIMLCFIFIVYITSVYKEMLGGTMTAEKKEKYTPAKVRLSAVSFGVVGILTVFGVCLFMRSLSNLYQETGTMDTALAVLDARLQLRDIEKDRAGDYRKSLHVDYAQRLADLLEKYPHLNEKENLKELSDAAGAAYIMLFDSSGRQVSTSSDYINMELGAENADKPDSTADFRRILKGVPSIAHNATRDEVTGRTLELVGVRTNDQVNGGYGVLILAMNPEDRNKSDQEEIDAIIKSLTPAGKLCFSVDPATKTIIYSSSEEFLDYYYDTESVGLRDSMLHDGVSDFIVIGGKKHFCISNTNADSGLIYYYCAPTEMLFGKGAGYAVMCAIGFGIVFTLLCLYLLKGYNGKMIEEAEKRGPDAAAEESKYIRVFSKARSFISHKMSKLSPEEKALLTLRVILALAIVNLVADYHRRGANTQSAFVFDYILGGKWNRGVNLFSLTAVIILLCGMMLLMFFVRLVLGMTGNLMSSRGETIGKLIANMIGYLSIIIFFYYALSYLGVDTNAILASVGVMGIGLSMGARDLISDILSGISLIFEGEYQVGDIVSIDNYRGMVQEVGVRTTKLIGSGGNIKTIRNSDVKNVINLTKLNSWVKVTIKVDVNYPLKDAEAILSETLPRVGENCKEIISGPYYKGVTSVEAGYAVLTINAECQEDNAHKVERTLLREVLLALREKNVPVK